MNTSQTISHIEYFKLAFIAGESVVSLPDSRGSGDETAHREGREVDETGNPPWPQRLEN
jgi:hypothetical protein